MHIVTKAALAALCATALAAPAAAKPNGNNNGTGWGVGQIPPGHCKKIDACRAGVVDDGPDVQIINNYIVIEQPTTYGLPTLPADQLYVRRDNEVYRIMRDTAVVVEAIGIVSELLN
ncbi:hypothetical protein [Maritimibacter sp. UBA3975]|uniref:hypothetical protein n=1 Tax=Maritimibacter sp. UBA3975 TaxID=1946833 RepID=UPI000C09B233|nr:hypothetical protein [Maritimibacter sp. UBA3975]MAM63065.1 hypothetical protein [Maritimibacter sp.]|tara:strand:- start:6222 stop:6572 length:351 start_codon:yes stop_codon:yes gene_type:complete